MNSSTQNAAPDEHVVLEVVKAISFELETTLGPGVVTIVRWERNLGESQAESPGEDPDT